MAAETEPAHFDFAREFGRFVMLDLKRAKVPNQRLTAVALATVSTMRAFLMSYRREVLRKNPDLTALELAEGQAAFEKQLLTSLARALPLRGKRGRKRDPEASRKFERILFLRCYGKTWPEVVDVMNHEFGLAARGTWQTLYRRYMPRYLDPRIPSTLLALRRLTVLRRPPGRRRKEN